MDTRLTSKEIKFVEKALGVDLKEQFLSDYIVQVEHAFCQLTGITEQQLCNREHTTRTTEY